MNLLREARRPAHYLKEIWRTRNVEGREPIIREVADLPTWYRSLETGTPLSDRRPWITFGAQRALQRHLRPSDRVFEYGSGGSTLFFASRCREVVAVEHDSAWAEIVRATLDGATNATLRLVEPTPEPDLVPSGAMGTYSSRSQLLVGQSLRAYVQAIDEFEDGHFDVLLVDGRARPTALAYGERKVRPGGWVVLDDSQRSGYQEAVELARRLGWAAHHYAGPGPYAERFWRTTIWTKPLI